MDPKTFESLKQRLHSDDQHVHVVRIADREIGELTLDQARELAAMYGANSMMLLPEWEREFFNWLRAHDEPVWNDLWTDDGQPYFVSISHLPDLLPTRRGFLISDLATEPNACFGIDNIVGEGGASYLDAALGIVKADGRLRIEQAFIVEVYRAPIDQWRFAYMYDQPLPAVKQMVGGLLLDEVLGFPQPQESEQDDDAMEDAG